MMITDSVYTDRQMDIIPFGKMTEFFNANM